MTGRRQDSPAIEQPHIATSQRRGSLHNILALTAIGFLAVLACTPGGVGQKEVSLSYPVAEEGSGAAGSTETKETAETTMVERSFQVFTVLPPDRIPAIRQPEFVTADEAESWMLPDEPVIGVEINGEARAYSTFMLSRHEIVNDTLGGRPIAVTW